MIGKEKGDNNPRITLKKLVFIQLIIPHLANIVAALSGNLMGLIFSIPGADQEIRRLQKESGSTVLIAFGSSILFFIIYNYPIWIDAARKRPFSDRSKKRFLNSAFIYGLLSIPGWGISILGNLILVHIHEINLPLSVMVFMSVANMTYALLCMTIIYYLVELINRNYLMHHFFPNGKIGGFTSKRTASIKLRFFIMFISISAFPMIILVSSIYSINQTLLYLGQEVVIPNDRLFIVSSILAIMGIFITWLVSRFYETPLRELKIMTEHMNRGHYNERLPVRSGDELGLLTESVNNMAKGLAEKEFIMETFGRVVDPSVRDHLLKGNINPGGEQRMATVLFSDIRDFTTFSEKNTPQQIVTILNRYFDRMNQAIAVEGGLVNKFIGDAVMALFNAPLDLPSHEVAACRAAIRMIRERDNLNRELKKEGFEPLRTGIGIHTGYVLAGNIGAQNRMEYTVIGDAVNVASRIEGMTRKTDNSILISGVTKSALSGAFIDENQIKRIGNVKVKGRNEPVEIFGFA